MTNPKKILLACPTLGLWADPTKWLTTLLRITNDVRRNGMSHACVFPYKETWWPANNQIWDAAFQADFDYILRIDDDIWGAHPTAFTMLLEADKDVIGAAYPLRQFPYSVCAFRADEEHKDQRLPDLWKNNKLGLCEVGGSGVQEVDLVGFGMTLIKVDPFKYLERPMYRGPEECPDDTYFAQVCKDNGIQQHVHMDVKLAHRDITPFNRGYLFNADARFFLQTGHIHGGNKFHDGLIEMFGADGQKDIGQLKGLDFVEPKRIVEA